MRTSILVSVLLAFALPGANDLAGQWLEDANPVPFRADQVQRPITLPQLAPDLDGPPSWRSRILTGFGAAAVGAFIGFFASEVAVGDWDARAGAKEPSRSLWAAAGGAVGMAVGLKFPVTGGSSGPGTTGIFRSNRFTIIAEEVQKASLTNAYEAVTLLRPEWLTQRGRDSATELGTDNIRVYLDALEIGGIEALRQVESTNIEAIQFIGAGRATLLFGAGHIHGVIQVITPA